MRCFCGELLNTTKELSDGYCEECHLAMRTVWDKDAFILGQEGKLDWTSAEEDDKEYIQSLGYKGDISYE